MNKSYKSSLTLLIAGIFSLATFADKVQAQSENTPPAKFIKFQDANNFKITANGNPFKPADLTQSNKPSNNTRGIIGPDDRLPMMSREYPWSTVGRIVGVNADGNSEYTCTGTLIAQDIVLTNSHCVIDPESHTLSKKIYFLPNVINREVLDKADIAQATEVIYGTDFRQSFSASQVNDWALIKLNKPIGLKYGYLGWKSLPASTLVKSKNKFIFVGYSGDFPNPEKQGYEELNAGSGWTASFQSGCSILREDKGTLYHDCDTTAGSSGGPIIEIIDDHPYIVALNDAEVRDTNRKAVVNLAVEIGFLNNFKWK